MYSLAETFRQGVGQSLPWVGPFSGALTVTCFTVRVVRGVHRILCAGPVLAVK